MQKPDSSITNLQRSIALYRRLVSLNRNERSEDEVIRNVVDAVFEAFPAYRTSFSRVDNDDMANIIYSRQPEGSESLSGVKFSLAKIPSVLKRLRTGEAVISPDVRKIPELAPMADVLVKLGGTISRVDLPVRESEDSLFVLTVGHPSPVEWENTTVELLEEVVELISQMIREARASQNLHRTETLFRQFAENIRLVIWMTDATKMEMVYVSPAYEEIWGRPRQSLYENPLAFVEAIHPDDRERVKNAIMRQALDQYEQQYRVVKPNGEIRWVKDRGFQVRDEEGKVQRIVGIAEDITALREAQNRLEATQAQVVTNTKFAALGEMASGIAHEINNPLAVIHGLTVQLQELHRKDQLHGVMVKDSLVSIEKMSNRIAGIVKGLRTFSRQTEGDPMSPADLTTIVQETLAMCEPKLHAAGIEIELKLPPQRIWIHCRSSEISQVVLNLVSNAYDAVLAKKQRKVTISAFTNNGGARLHVEDNGGGIAANLRDRIFQPFFTTKEVGKGTGLGLSISKGIVEAHGGHLYLDATAPETRFVVELPLEKQ